MNLIEIQNQFLSYGFVEYEIFEKKHEIRKTNFKEIKMKLSKILED